MAGDAAIGSVLRAARERIGLGIAQAAQQLNLDPEVVRALEDERFAQLGAPVFVRGHLRRYADLLGESADVLQDRYAAWQGAAEPDLTQVPRAAAPPDPRRYRAPAVILAGLLVLIGIIWWALHATPAG